MTHPARAAAAFVAAALSFAALAPGAHAASDSKTVAASHCAPYAPDTTAAELAYTQTGIYNGGTTNEKVLCAMPRDQDLAYADSELAVAAYYRVLGGTAARMTCTIFVNSASQEGSVYTNTASGGLVAAGQRSLLLMYAPAQASGLNSSPVSMLCVIPPKTSFSSIIMTEFGATTLP